LNTVVVFPLTAVPRVFPSCANAGAANATGSATATSSVDIRFMFFFILDQHLSV